MTALTHPCRSQVNVSAPYMRSHDPPANPRPGFDDHDTQPASSCRDATPTPALTPTRTCASTCTHTNPSASASASTRRRA